MKSAAASSPVTFLFYNTAATRFSISSEMHHTEVVTKREMSSEEQQGLTWGFQNKTKECRMGEWG